MTEKGKGLKEMQAKELVNYEFPPLEDVAGREFIKTENGYHIYRKKVTKNHGELEAHPEIKVPATIQQATDDNIEFWGAVQRRILDDKANYIRQTQLVTDEEKKERMEKQKDTIAQALETLNPEEKEAFLKELGLK